MSKAKKLLHKLSTGALSSVAALALMVTATNVSTCCWFILGQDKLPDNAKNFVSFNGIRYENDCRFCREDK